MAQQTTPETAMTTEGDFTRRPSSGMASRARPLFRPRADVYETADDLVVMAEMPGVAPGDLEVTLEGGVLAIRGRTPDVEHAGYRRIYAEYGEGDYERSFAISEAVDRERITAKLQDGVLVLTLPKAEQAKPRKIKVKSA